MLFIKFNNLLNFCVIYLKIFIYFIVICQLNIKLFLNITINLLYLIKIKQFNIYILIFGNKYSFNDIST
jgi:hypothetical protein